MRNRALMEFTIGTLAANTAILGSSRIDATRLNGCTIDKLRYNVSWFGKTAGVNEGPISYGFSRSMTIAQIAEFFAADPQSRADVEALEQSHRPIVVLGVVGQSQVENSTAGPNDSMRNGKFPWDILEGMAFSPFVFNNNPANPMTGGMFLQLYHEEYGSWLKD